MATRAIGIEILRFTDTGRIRDETGFTAAVERIYVLKYIDENVRRDLEHRAAQPSARLVPLLRRKIFIGIRIL